MTFKRFLAPNLIVILILSIAWDLGYERVFKEERTDQVNLQKYIQVQRVILDNHFNEIAVSDLYYSSLKGFVRNMENKEFDLKDTPLDTTQADQTIDNLRLSVQHFERA